MPSHWNAVTEEEGKGEKKCYCVYKQKLKRAAILFLTYRYVLSPLLLTQNNKIIFYRVSGCRVWVPN